MPAIGTSETAGDRPPASVVIPNWNGKALLEENLPAVLAAADLYPAPTEVIVVDDGSTDGSVQFVRRRFPGIRVVERDRNGGFAVACTDGIRAARYEVVVLLNSDVSPRPDFLAPLLAHFARDDVFAVSCLSVSDEAGTPREGAKVPRRPHDYGRLKDIYDVPSAVPTLYAVGGHCALRRCAFFQIGGFDPLFEPFYWEDLDLCYRAWKRGWRVLFEPRSVVLHRRASGAITSTFRQWRIRKILRRNRVLFHWKNLNSPPSLLLRYVLSDLRRSLYRFLKLDFNFYASRLAAVRCLAAALRARRRMSGMPVLRTDREIFEMVRRGIRSSAG